ncbi:hypothetical protein [Streptacidiphilus albus]|uniref:hypothetical protein n=1 Tax=Streptacidiphilus albus TaxID=105425 RepID=UPI000B17DB33|nr:hypothetical protein [Streptacidiphilus albus]
MTKSDREIMEIFEAYDLTETVWSAATLTGHDPKTVKRYVEARASGRNPYEREPRPKMIDAFLEKIEEWVEQSKATIRSDVVHDKLVTMGYPGSARSTRRAVNAAKTVTVEHIAGIPVRHPQMVAAGRHYGCQVVSCVPYEDEDADSTAKETPTACTRAATSPPEGQQPPTAPSGLSAESPASPWKAGPREAR